jgi:hypothetical protein
MTLQVVLLTDVVGVGAAGATQSVEDSLAAGLVAEGRAERAGSGWTQAPGVETLTTAQVQAVQAAIDAGQLDVFAGSKLPTLAGVPVGSITLNAGSGNTVSALRLTFAPPTDTIGAQRLLVPTDETFVLAVGSTRSFTIDELAGTALVMHAVGVSSSTTYTGAAYVIGSAEADLADALANDARLEWLSDDIARVDVTVEQGSTAQTAIVSILGWTR